MLDLLAQTEISYNYNLTSDDKGALAGFFAFLAAYIIIVLVVAVLAIACMWVVYKKAGRNGWEAIVPFYNTWVLAEICGKPGWWMFLFFVPVVNFIVAIILMIELAKVFGKDTTFAILLIFLPIIGYAMLAFGDAKYVGPGHAPAKKA